MDEVIKYFKEWFASLFEGFTIENLSKEDAAREILCKEITIKYNPVIVELDRKPTNVEPVSITEPEPEVKEPVVQSVQGPQQQPWLLRGPRRAPHKSRRNNWRTRSE